MKNLITIFFAVLLELIFFNRCEAKGLCSMNYDAVLYTRAEIYFLSWNTFTRIRQSPDDVRKNKNIYLVMNFFYIDKILKGLKSIEFKNYDGDGGDARFVMDLHNSNGSITTYYADDYYIYSPKLKCYGKMTPAFFEAINVFKK
jgi:hypothetical protein